MNLQDHFQVLTISQVQVLTTSQVFSQDHVLITSQVLHLLTNQGSIYGRRDHCQSE